MNYKQLLTNAIDSHDNQTISRLIDILPKLDFNTNTFIKHNCTIERINCLIEMNINIDFGRFMKHAISAHIPDIVEILLKNKLVDPNDEIYSKLTECEESFLHLAIHRVYEMAYIYGPNESKMVIVKMLVQNGANIHATNSNNKNIMVYATGNIMDRSHCYDNDGIEYKQLAYLIKYFVGLGLDANTRDSSRCTPLHRSTQPPDPDLYKYILSHGADPNAINTYGYTPLHSIVKKQYKSCHGTDIDLNADSHDDVEYCIKILIQFGADPFVDNHGKNAIDDAYPDLKKVIMDELDMMDVPVKGVHGE